MNKDIDMGVSGDQRREMCGYWILGVYNPRIIIVTKETKWSIRSISGLQTRGIFFPFDILDH